jgi:hypothetical protein
MNLRIKQLLNEATSGHEQEHNKSKVMTVSDKEMEKFAELIVEECAREVEEFARKWWSIHCHGNKHAETTRKAHDDFCALQRAIRRRGKTE